MVWSQWTDGLAFTDTHQGSASSVPDAKEFSGETNSVGKL